MITDVHVTLLAIGSIFVAVAAYGWWLYRLQKTLDRGE